MKKLFLLLASSACFALACGTTVTTPGDTGSSTTGQGGATSASSSGGNGGSFVTSSTATGTSTYCSDPTIFFDIEGDGPSQLYDPSCMPIGFLVWPGDLEHPGPPPEPMAMLSIQACTAGPSYHLTFSTDPQMWPAMGSVVGAGYQNGSASYSLSGVGSVDVLTFGPVGGVIEGNFSLAVTDGGTGNIMLFGKFRVCRVPDEIPV